MIRVLLGAAGCLLAVAVAPANAHAAAGWLDPQRVSAAPTAQGGTYATDQATDGEGNVFVAYQQCGQPPGGCSLDVVTREAASGDWTEPTTVAPPVEGVEGPSTIALEANAAGDVAVTWQTCAYGGNICAIYVAIRPRGNDAWTPPTLVVEESITHANDWNFAPDLALAPDGTITVAWNRGHRHESNFVSTVEVLARSGAVANPAVEQPQLVLDPHQTIGPDAASNDRAAAPVIVTTADGTTVAAWWYRGDCHVLRYAVRPAGGSWATPQTLGGPDCATATTFMTPEYVLAASGNDAVFVYSAAVTDENGATGDELGTWATTIEAAGTLGPTTKLSDRLIGLDSDPTSGDGDLTRAQFARNAAGQLVLAASELGDDSTDRPIVAVRAANGTWGPVVPVEPGASTPVNAGLDNPAPGVSIADDGRVTVAWSRNLGVATPEDPWPSDHAVQVAELAPGGTAFGAPLRLSSSGVQATRPLLGTAPGGTPIVTWRQGVAGLHGGATAIYASEPTAAPEASFSWAPQSPVAGQTVTFTSTSIDPDDDPATLTYAWDFDGDGDFGDGAGATAAASFDAAGDYVVELRVTDPSGLVDEASATVTVGPAPITDPGPGPGPDPTPGDHSGPSPGSPPRPGSPPSSGPQSSPSPGPGPQPQPQPLPAGFVVRSSVDTNGQRAMPAVAGRPVDLARDRVQAALLYADVKVIRTTASSAKLGKRPGGGKWKLGDVVAQTPAAGARVPGSAANPVPVTLTYWAGAGSSKSRCDALRASVKGDELDLALAQLKAARCGTPDLKLKASKRADDPTVKSLSKDHDDLTVNVPTDQSKLDIVIWKNTGFLGTSDPGPVPSANGDLQLTAGQQNVAGVILRDRAGQPLNRASVTWDLSGVGGGEKTSKSIESGVAPIKLTPAKAGTVRVIVQWSDASGDSIYGYTEFKVVDRAKEPGFVTAIGQSFKRSGTGKSAVFKPGGFKAATARRASVGNFFQVLADAIRSWGGPIAASVNATPEAIFGVAKTFQTSVAQLWRGPVTGPPQAANPRFTTVGMWLVQPNGVVSAGGANVVAAGGMNVISAGGANVVAAGGMNVISAGGANVVSAGGGNLITLPDGARVVSAGGANVVAAGGMNVISAGGAN